MYRLARIRSKKAGNTASKPQEKCQHQGRVVTRYGAELILLNEQNEHIRCTARRKFENIACGDYVCWQPSEQGNSIVTDILPRKNALTRPDHRGKPKAIACNIDQIIIVCSWLPKPSWMLVDQYLIAAQLINADALLVINKADLAEQYSTEKDHKILDEYNSIGYNIIHANALTGLGIDEIQKELSGKTSIFVGQSGVGKSSIIGQALPELNIKVGDISQKGEGKHTTTTADLYRVGKDGFVIDSPGVRDFAIANVDADGIRKGYREFDVFAKLCRFNNCTHTHEPRCIVKQAAETNDIPTGRYRRYLAKLELLAEQQEGSF